MDTAHNAMRASYLKPLPLLVAAYFAASLAHFGHNAQYIAFYPGMPAWLTPGTVWLCWFAVTGVGVLAWGLARRGHRALALLALGVYGALGLDGLLHYTLGLCTEHTLWANVTIWAEATTGLALLLVSAVLLARGRIAATCHSALEPWPGCCSSLLVFLKSAGPLA